MNKTIKYTSATRTSDGFVKFFVGNGVRLPTLVNIGSINRYVECLGSGWYKLRITTELDMEGTLTASGIVFTEKYRQNQRLKRELDERERQIKLREKEGVNGTYWLKDMTRIASIKTSSTALSLDKIKQELQSKVHPEVFSFLIGVGGWNAEIFQPPNHSNKSLIWKIFTSLPESYLKEWLLSITEDSRKSKFFFDTLPHLNLENVQYRALLEQRFVKMDVELDMDNMKYVYEFLTEKGEKISASLHPTPKQEQELQNRVRYYFDPKEHEFEVGDVVTNWWKSGNKIFPYRVFEINMNTSTNSIGLYDVGGGYRGGLTNRKYQYFKLKGKIEDYYA